MIKSNFIDRLRVRTIGFSGAITLISAIFIYATFAMNYYNDPMIFIRVGIVSTAYVLLSLITQDYFEISEFISEIWDTTQANSMSPDEKMIHIKNICELKVDEWIRYNYMYERIVRGNKKILWDAKRQFSDVLKLFINGEITIGKALWIYMYLIYSVIIGVNYMASWIPFDFIIMFGFLLVILLAAGKAMGMGKFMKILFENIKPETEKTVKKALENIEHEIQMIAKKYFFIRLQKEKAIPSAA